MQTQFSSALAERDSFKDTFHRGVLIDQQGRKDYDIIRLAKIQSKLTFDFNFLNPVYKVQWWETPFKEIRFTKPIERINPDYAYLLKDQPMFKGTIQEFTQGLVDGAKEYIRSNFNQTDKYLFFHSGGFDSRVISGCMRDLWNEGFKFDIHFRCHQPEEPMFLEIMKREGWEKDRYSVFVGAKENYYNIGTSEPLNGWQNYNHQMNFWSDITKNEKDYIVVTGLGGELFKYILLHSKDNITERCPNRFINILMQFNPDEGQWGGFWMRKFKDLLIPLLGYPYLTRSLTANPKWCIWNGKTDAVRVEFTRRFKYNITDVPYGQHDYSWNLTDKFFKGLTKKFHASKFYKDFGKHMGTRPDFTKINSWDAKIWGFMTTYDAIYE
jgi:hypothetical protein